MALVSGGLDSLLAAKLIQNQGIEVIGIHFRIPFCKLDPAESFAQAKIELLQFDLGQEFLELLKHPRYGFGSNMNPCIDCKILMFAKAKELLTDLKADFIISGEVLGQRPMSQNKQALRLIKERSGLGQLLLRPLSAKFFAPSLAEKSGWVKPEALLNFNGRRRGEQTQLAQKLGIVKYAYPAGGCLLTDPSFSKRLRELLSHQELNLENLKLLKVGRHFRVGENARLVVGRDAQENNLLLQLAIEEDYLFSPEIKFAGPTVLMRGVSTPELFNLALEITAAYSDTAGFKEIKVCSRRFPDSRDKEYQVVCLAKSKFVPLLI